jgi:hypothetical protein
MEPQAIGFRTEVWKLPQCDDRGTAHGCQPTRDARTSETTKWWETGCNGSARQCEGRGQSRSGRKVAGPGARKPDGSNPRFASDPTHPEGGDTL